MTAVKPLSAQELYQSCDLQEFTFDTTAELEDLSEIIGQDRALSAITFGINVPQLGYNIFVMGPNGAGKFTTVRQLLEKEALAKPTPPDWCYLYNFKNPHQPKALKLPAGEGAKLRAEMTSLIDDLRIAIPAAFESDEYRARVLEIDEELKEKQDKAVDSIRLEAKEKNIELIRTPTGFAFAPAKNGEVMSPEDFDKLPEKDQEKISQLIDQYHERLRKLIHQIPQWHKESRAKIKTLNREFARSLVGQSIDVLRKKFSSLPDILQYLDDVEHDISENINAFRRQEEGAATLMAFAAAQTPTFRRYEVNVLVDSSQIKGVPVHYEDYPSYPNLVGRIEHYALMGALLTDFTLIKPGVLHRANGGYLILDARKILMQPLAWEGLKRILRSREIRIESLEQLYSLASTVTLQPECIPLDIKVILIGDRQLYYLLHELDPEFHELFKVMADFEDSINRTPANHVRFAHLIAGLAKKHQLLPFDRPAVARVIEYRARYANDAEKISTHARSLLELMQEADYWAKTTKSKVIGKDHIQKAIDTRLYHASRISEHLYESIIKQTLLIDTAGETVGQVNGLSVTVSGDHTFGIPHRITASVHLGKGEIIDIEREVELGGPIHAKGVLILSALLGARYSLHTPLALSASLVFEQSYSEIEGDSASAAEALVLISAISNVALHQAIAVTGSINQLGQIQAIGGVNEKIEGFFDVCMRRGISDRHGVIIPAANVKHLMLRQDVVDACAAGKFNIYPIHNLDQGIEILTGVEAGVPDENGIYPEASVNGRAQARIQYFSKIKATYENE